jgi:hypothetical protein
VVQGDAKSVQDVKAVCEGCDVVVCCTGNSKNNVMMEALAKNVVAACQEDKISRCYFITSLGFGGSSPVIRFVLGMIGLMTGVGFVNIRDYEAADKLLLDSGFTVVRPTELVDKGEPAGKYLATSETGMAFNGGVHKSDVALFLCEEITKNEWGGKPVQVYKAK